MTRAELIRTLYPQSVPALWCPLITHYRAKGEFDEARTTAHLRSLAPYVGGFLAPGSTGEGWEMDNEEIRELLSMLMKHVNQIQSRLLIGVLKTGRKESTSSARQILEELAIPKDIHAQYLHNFFGITVTAPQGSELDQKEIAAELKEVLELGYPTALYQLPQITGNEIHPSTAKELAQNYSNFYLFKDTSGKDTVALSGELPEDIFLLRGAEGDYAQQLTSSGGPYYGFLLSTANCFAPQLSDIIAYTTQGLYERAAEISDRIEHTVEAAFQAVGHLSFGNPFANANRAMDHFMAYGLEGYRTEPPLAHSGDLLPQPVIDEVGQLLENADLLPPRGYLQG